MGELLILFTEFSNKLKAARFAFEFSRVNSDPPARY